MPGTLLQLVLTMQRMAMGVPEVIVTMGMPLGTLMSTILLEIFTRTIAVAAGIKDNEVATNMRTTRRTIRRFITTLDATNSAVVEVRQLEAQVLETNGTMEGLTTDMGTREVLASRANTVEITTMLGNEERDGEALAGLTEVRTQIVNIVRRPPPVARILTIAGGQDRGVGGPITKRPETLARCVVVDVCVEGLDDEGGAPATLTTR